MAAFTRRMRRTASSMRERGTSPAVARAFSSAMNWRYRFGTMNMSMPAFTDCLIWAR